MCQLASGGDFGGFSADVTFAGVGLLIGATFARVGLLTRGGEVGGEVGALFADILVVACVFSFVPTSLGSAVWSALSQLHWGAGSSAATEVQPV